MAKLSINELRERMSKEDMELTCTRTLQVEVSIWYSSDDTGVLRERGVNITLYISVEEDGTEPTTYTLNMQNEQKVVSKNTIIEIPLTLDDAARALGISTDTKIWEVKNTDD